MRRRRLKNSADAQSISEMLLVLLQLARGKMRGGDVSVTLIVAGDALVM